MEGGGTAPSSPPNPADPAPSNPVIPVFLDHNVSVPLEIEKLNKLCNIFIKFQDYHLAQGLLDKHESNFSDANDLALFEELRAYIDRMLGKKESSYVHASRAYNLYQRANNEQQNVRRASTYLILGERDSLAGEPEKALDKYKLGLKLDRENTELLKKKAEVDEYISAYQRSMELQRQILDQEAAEEKQRIEEEKRKRQRIEEGKRKKLEGQGVLVDQGSFIVDDTKTREATQELSETHKKVKDIVICDSITMLMDSETYQGKVVPKFGEEYYVTFLVFDEEEVKYYNNLKKLCSSQDTLLLVHHLTKHPDNEFYLLVVEQVMTFEEYCTQLATKFRESSHDPTRSTWWPYVKDVFYLIFRELIEVLLFLYLDKFRSCGKLKGHLYVTWDGHARILPCMGKSGGSENSKKASDLSAMIHYMKMLLFFPFREEEATDDVSDVSFGFPKDLISFFKFASNYKMLDVEYVLKHPFSWTLVDRVYYPNLVKKALFRPPPNVRSGTNKLRSRMNQLNPQLNKGFFEWANKVAKHGLLHAIWKKGDPTISLTEEQKVLMAEGHLLQVSPYRDEVSIIRYFDATFDHANDKTYSEFRTKETMTPEDIDQELMAIFPDFYVIIYESIGICVAKRDLDQGLLLELYGKNKGC